MTPTQIGKLREQFIRLKEDALSSAVTRAQRELLNQILDELFKQLGDSGGSITDSRGNELKLSQVIKKVFENFNRNQNAKLINQIISSTEGITTLNKRYFNKLLNQRAELLQQTYDKVDAIMQKRIGIGSDGRLIRGGYLYKLLTNQNLRNDVLRATRKAYSGNATVEQYMNSIREIVNGNENYSGGLSYHYRTFAHDVFGDFDAGYSNEVATRLELNAAVYEGGVISTTRDFCRKKNGRVFTRAEIKNFVNDPDLLLTKEERDAGAPSDYNPESNKPGRWNCRHYYNWITNEEAIRLRPSLKNLPEDAWR